MYASPDDVDLAIGGSLESHAPESILGPTFQCIIGRQFFNARTGDRFFFERYQSLSGFSKGWLRFSINNTLYIQVNTYSEETGIAYGRTMPIKRRYSKKTSATTQPPIKLYICLCLFSILSFFFIS